MAETLCHGEDPELWFPTTERGRRKAIAICKRCPTQESCLAHALDHKIAHGVWGGLTPTERDRLTPAPGTAGALTGTTLPSQAPSTASDRAGDSSATPPDAVECPQCQCAFTNAAAYDAHRPNGKCLKPTDCGLVVAPRVKLTWSVPVRVPIAFDPFGNPTEFVDADPEVARQWDTRVWRDHP